MKLEFVNNQLVMHVDENDDCYDFLHHMLLLERELMNEEIFFKGIKQSLAFIDKNKVMEKRDKIYNYPISSDYIKRVSKLNII